MIEVNSAQAVLEKAKTYWQTKQWQLTIQACAEALALDRNLALAQKLMGDALQKTGKAKEALGYYLQAIEIEPDLVEVYVEVGNLYTEQKQWERAIDYYQQALAIDPKLVEVDRHLARVLHLQQRSQTADLSQSTSTLQDYLHQGEIAQSQGNLEIALEKYRQAAQIAPQNIDIYHHLANLSEELKLWEDAANYCHSIWQLSNKDRSDGIKLLSSVVTTQYYSVAIDSAKYHYNLAILQAKQQQWDLAVRHYQQAILEDPQMAMAYCDLARTFAQMGEQQQSIEAWLQAIALDCQGISAAEYLELAQNLTAQKKIRSAIICYRRAIEQQPDFAAAYLGWGELLTETGATNRAIACYLKALKHIRDNCQIYYRLGSLYQTAQKLSQAAVCFQKATQCQPDFAQAHYQLGKILAAQEKWADAIQAYRQAIEHNPNFRWSYHDLGNALIQVGQWMDAISVYQRAIALFPNFSWYYYNLAQAYSALNRWTEAIEYYYKAAQIQPDLPRIQQKLGSALYHRSQQDLQRALEQFEAAIALEPDNLTAYRQALAIDRHNIELYLKLADILVQQDKLDEAIVTYQTALQIQPQNEDIIIRMQEILPKKTN